ncbi:CatB-related O-acetyltransferase [Shimia sp. MMG029]|uniref:CatB-related O-acetyltransferase n=1 Tax=Shimia sp. MMG029 TaxID=3021978 RepID=UPI0022FE51F0|nr:CatB-related O-acetyltransferase [Shimia sp. MMG029]MDA5556775.1 CatB-related O-acetyltransferase [Shimia sp. MMG029]
MANIKPSQLRPFGELTPQGLRVVQGIDTRGKHLHVRFEAPSQLNNAPAFYYQDLEIGMYSYLRTGIVRYVDRIGRYCSIGPGVTIGEGEHPTNWLSTSPSQYTYEQFKFYPPEKEATKRRRVARTAKNNTGAQGHVTIGHDVWIGGGATIRRGVKIGHGAIVSGNAFVTKDVPPYAIVAGLPAQHMRFRFDRAVIERLLALRWWRFDINDLAGVAFDNIETALDEIEAREAAGEIAETPQSFKSVQIYTKGHHGLGVEVSAPRSFPAPEADPLGLSMLQKFEAEQAKAVREARLLFRLGRKARTLLPRRG